MKSRSGVLQSARRTASALEKWAYRQGLRSPRRLTLPDFLGIGAQKAGTTWLDRCMRCHADLFLPAQRKELHYFDKRFDQSLRSYARKFAAGEGKVRGEITPGYATLGPERVRFIRAIMPDARLIFLLRHPVQRAWSHAQMHLLTRRGRTLDEVSLDDFYAHFRQRGVRLRGDYLRTLDTWLECFPEEQLYVGFFEDVSRRPREMLEEVFEHVGVRKDVDWDSFPLREVVHKGGGIPMPDAIREHLEELYAAQIEGLYERFGDRVAAWRLR